MSLHLNIYGQVYDDSEPCFLRTADLRFVYNRVAREWIKWPSLEALAVREGYTFKDNEVGAPSSDWVAKNFSFNGIEWDTVVDPIVIPPSAPDFVVLGPYQAGETKFFIQKFRADLNKECMVWLDVDSDPDPDVALTKQAICESDINDQAKMAIDAQLKADGCTGLPCMTPAGNVQKKYSKGE